MGEDLEGPGNLFHLARRRKEPWQPGLGPEGQSAEFASRQQELAEAVRKFCDMVCEEAVPLADQAAIDRMLGADMTLTNAKGKALAAQVRLEGTLTTFVDDPSVPMDNNASERAVRGPVIARKLSFWSGGPTGAETAASLFSVLETVRMNGLNPYTWMQDYLGACARGRGDPRGALDPWLPWRMGRARCGSCGPAGQAGSKRPAAGARQGHGGGRGGAASPDTPLAG
ncbi:MAG: transposase [Bryobacterales bacterium]|nr:transposase [Bryobacterales bacterium]